MYPRVTPDYFPLLNIYSDEKPDFLLPFLEAPVLQRLNDISQGCGTEYCKFYTFKVHQSRLTHSIGVALIVRHFTHDQKQTLAGLFHDISHSIFSHVGDFLLGDPVNQESSEQHMNKLLSEDPVILNELEKLWITIAEVDDYTMYPIADNYGPQLSADRLEYTLSTALVFGTRTLDEIKAMYDNLSVLEDEQGNPEVGFVDPLLAKQFALLALENDEQIFSSYESVVSMCFIAEILSKMLERKLITSEQMYTWTESETIQCIQDSWDTELIEMRRFFEQLQRYKVQKTYKETGYFTVSSKAKKRYIDPLVQTPNGQQRISRLFPDFLARKDYHISRNEEWISIDWKN